MIVESPAKAKTIAGYLGNDYMVESSVGHVRDLPHSAAEVPAAQKQEPWARLGVNVDSDFEPLYVVDPKKKGVVSELRSKLKSADELLLATDEDREGEAIAWHLVQVLSPKVPVRRMVFHEITKSAIEQALDETREIDDGLVDAQETRRILDRLYGYEVSPVLWKKVMKGLSAGRVQSVATRLVVERERERIEFRAAEYLGSRRQLRSGRVRGAADRGRREAGRDRPRFRPDRRADHRGRGAARRGDRAGARESARGRRLRGSLGRAQAVHAAAGGAVHDLDVAAGGEPQASVLGAAHDARRAAPVRERLHHLHAHRLDVAVGDRDRRGARPGPRGSTAPRSSRPSRGATTARSRTPRRRTRRSVPAGDRFRTPDEVRRELSGEEAALYDLVWKRTVASQMADARGETVSVRIGAVARASGEPDREVEFGTAGTVITFRGFMLAYEEGRDEAVAADEEERRLPPLAEGDAVEALGLEPDGHSTVPPARYTEASLVRALEERGIGRPSTYATIMGTILDRGYVRKVGQALVPSFLAFSVTQLLEQHFTKLVDYEFTALLEDDLDRIAAGTEERTDWLRRFYFGDTSEPGTRDEAGLKALVSDLGDIDARAINTIEIGNGIELRVGRYGPYIERDGQRLTISDEIAPDELTVERAEELLAQGSEQRTLGIDPDTGRTIAVKNGRYGPYVTELAEEGNGDKPRTASLFKSMAPESVTLEDALRLLSLPRIVGIDPADGEEIVAANGRYGPFVKRGSDTRSLESEDQLFTLTTERGARAARPAEAARPTRRGSGAAPGARGRSGQRQEDDRQERPLRSVRDRRRDEREPALVRRRRDADRRARRRADGGPPRTRPGEAAAASSHEQVMPGQHLGEARVAGFVHTAC